MALSRTNLLSEGAGAFSYSAWVGSSFTPPSNSLLVVCIHVQELNGNSDMTGDLTVSGGGWTYTPRVAVANTTPWARGLAIFTAPVGTGASMALTIDCGGRECNYFAQVFAYEGYNTSTPTGATATDSDIGTDGAQSITLSGAPASDSEVIALLGCNTISDSSATPGSGWTEQYDVYAGNIVFESQTRTGSTSTTVAWADINDGGAGTYGASFAAALEIPAAGGGGVTGSGAITLDPLTVAGAGVRRANGSGSITLAALQVSGAGTRRANGAGAITLLPVEVAGTGERVITGSGNIPLPETQVAGSGTVGAVITGAGAIVLDPLQVAGAGTRRANGAGAITLPLVEVAGAGTRQANGSGALLLEALQVAGAGTRGANGSGAITLGPFEVAGAGSTFSGIGGSGAMTLEAFTVNGAGVRGANGAGAISLAALAVAGAGDVETPTTGSGNLLLAALEVSGAGTRGVTGTGAIFLPAFQVSGFEIPPTPGGAYKFIDGTAFDENGRMLTRFIDPGDPLPYTGNFLEGLAHDSGGRRYVTSWPGSAGYIGGFAVRADGVQVIAADATPVRAIGGLGVTSRGEAAATDAVPVNAVGGFGTDALGRLCVTEKN